MLRRGGDSGIFFDDQNDKDPDAHFAFSKDCLAAVTKAYLPIIEKYVHDQTIVWLEDRGCVASSQVRFGLSD